MFSCGLQANEPQVQVAFDLLDGALLRVAETTPTRRLTKDTVAALHAYFLSLAAHRGNPTFTVENEVHVVGLCVAAAIHPKRRVVNAIPEN